MIYSTLRRWASGVRGNTAVTFALMVLPIFAVAGFAIDASRQVALKQHAQIASDLAALAGARNFKESFLTADAKAAAITAFASNIASAHDDSSCSIDEVTTNTASLSVTIETSCEVPTVFGVGISGKDTMRVRTKSTAQATYLLSEVSMMLDISESMNTTEIRDLKGAAKKAAEIIIGPAPHVRGRVAIVPFSTGVNAGNFGNLATGRASGEDPEGDDRTAAGAALNRVCVTERRGSEAHTDASPVHNPVGSVFALISAGGVQNILGTYNRRSADYCPESPVHPLDSNLTAVHNVIDNVARSSLIGAGGGGQTVGHLAVAWAWYTISPDWNDVWTNTAYGGHSSHMASDYVDPNVAKAVILMTDGVFKDFFHEDFYDHNPFTIADKSDASARLFCEGMRGKGIDVYAVQFGGAEQDVLKDCAGDPKRYYYATDSDELVDIYTEIAGDFMGVRLTN